MPDTRFLVGIDLGTTNSTVAAIDARRTGAPAAVVPLPQLTAPGTVEPRPLLPSFLYYGEPHEIDSGALALPWNARPPAVAGIFARLTLRDGKPRYLADAPRFIAYIRATAHRYRELGPLLRLIDEVEGLQAASGFAFGRV